MNDFSSGASATSVIDRRKWLQQTAGLAAMLGLSRATALGANSDESKAGSVKRAMIAITLDLEMSAQYPTKDQVHWNYEKGNLNEETKRYAVEAARRVKQAIFSPNTRISISPATRLLLSAVLLLSEPRLTQPGRNCKELQRGPGVS